MHQRVESLSLKRLQNLRVDGLCAASRRVALLDCNSISDSQVWLEALEN
ncbi:hypothetical protein ACF3DV_12375 [Chlorogloeopsis fritschii PCC 9212]